jgi:hypothetical protein
MQNSQLCACGSSAIIACRCDTILKFYCANHYPSHKGDESITHIPISLKTAILISDPAVQSKISNLKIIEADLNSYKDKLTSHINQVEASKAKLINLISEIMNPIIQQYSSILLEAETRSNFLSKCISDLDVKGETYINMYSSHKLKGILPNYQEITPFDVLEIIREIEAIISESKKESRAIMKRSLTLGSREVKREVLFRKSERICCEICSDTAGKFVKLEKCGHTFHLKCLIFNYELYRCNEGEMRNCPSSKCQELISEEDLSKLQSQSLLPLVSPKNELVSLSRLSLPTPLSSQAGSFSQEIPLPFNNFQFSVNSDPSTPLSIPTSDTSHSPTNKPRFHKEPYDSFSGEIGFSPLSPQEIPIDPFPDSISNSSQKPQIPFLQPNSADPHLSLDSKYKKCPIATCWFVVSIDKNCSKLNCPRCNQSYCLKCNRVAHDDRYCEIDVKSQSEASFSSNGPGTPKSLSYKEKIHQTFSPFVGDFMNKMCIICNQADLDQDFTLLRCGDRFHSRCIEPLVRKQISNNQPAKCMCGMIIDQKDLIKMLGSI